MANPVIGDLTATVTNTIGVEQSAKVLIDGFQQRLTDAVNAAVANGATEAELKPLIDLNTALAQESSDLAASVAANQEPPAAGRRK